MNARRLLVMLAALAVGATVSSDAQSAGSRPASCTPDLSWSDDPTNGPTIKEINRHLGRPPDQCHFHSLAWQWFLHLMHPNKAHPSLRNFEDSDTYSVLGRDVCPQCADKSDRPELSGWFVRNVKESTRDPKTRLFPFVEVGSSTKAHLSICSRGATGSSQPGSELTLHDQFGKVVFYRVLFKRNLCKIYAAGGRISGEPILEMKFSWRQIEEGDKNNYVHEVADLPILGPTLVGLVGMHLAIDTNWNQRLVWATFEHKQNAADCDKPTNDDGWSFTSPACAKCLRTGSLSSCGQVGAACDNINVGYARTGTTSSTITHVCRAHPSAGTDQTNRVSIDKLNDALVGRNGLLTRLRPRDPMVVLKNYFHVGTLWLPPDTDAPDQQQSSLLLANTSLESVQQERNCFSCHNPSGSRNSYPVSHILPPGPAASKR
jgi:hypothetical protein